MSSPATAHHSEGSATTHDDVFPLLEVPTGVEVLLLSFLSAGTGGLKNVLALRSVCSTTRSWVDHLPKPHADVIFSKAQVNMNSNLQSLRSFNSSSPPFGVTSLRLNISSIDGRREEAPEEETEAWNSFCSFWTTRKLVEVELHSTTNIYFQRHVTTLLDSVNIKKIEIIGQIVIDTSLVPPANCRLVERLPSSFHNLSELHMGPLNFEMEDFEIFEIGDLVRGQLYSVLANNNNLRVFTIYVEDQEDLEGLAKLIESKRHSPHFLLNLTLGNGSLDDIHTEAVSRWTQSILTSRSQFRLGVMFDWEQSLLLTHNGRSLSSLVESLYSWSPTQQNSSLLDFPRLKEVEEVNVIDSATAAQLTFPPSLEKVAIYKGAPNPANLPETLKKLCLQNYKCDVNALLSFLRDLSVRCPQLEELLVRWEPSEEKVPWNFQPPPQGFQKLRRLLFFGEFREEEVEYFRLGLKNAFNWPSLELHSLRLEFQDSHAIQRRELPLVVEEEFLRDVCEGASGNSLLHISIPEGSVTPEALPMLQRLEAVVGGNVGRRLEVEGPGAWQRTFSG